MPDKGLSEKDLKKAQEQIKEIKDFIKEMEDLGIEVSPTLKKALKGLEVALDTAEDLGSAFEEARSELATFEKDLLTACKSLDAEMQDVCELQVKRKWQARSVKFVLDYKNKDSVTAKFIKKTVQRYTPDKICEHWDYCRKEAKKDEARK